MLFVRRARLLTLLAAIVVTTSACQSLTFLAANAPAVFGPYDAHRDIKYGSLDRQALDVYELTADKTPRPVVVFAYGGGWTAGSKDDYRFVAEALVSRGFMVVLPDYRLYPAIKFPAFVDDIAQAVAWTHAHAAEYGGDPKRIYLMGHSAGAQITALVAFNAEYLARVGGNRSWIKGFIGLAGPYDFLPIKAPELREIFGPEAQYPKSQPIKFVGNRAVPALLIHGEADELVALKNSQSLAKQMRIHRARVVERYYPEMTHSDVVAALSVYYRDQRPVLDEIAKFIND